MQEITAPIIAITLVLLSVFVPVAFIPGISGELFRQFAGHRGGVDVPVGDQRADAVAGACAACCFVRITGRAAASIGMVMRSIDRVRDAYGGAVARLAARLNHRAGDGRGRGRRHLSDLAKRHADRLPARGRPGRACSS